MSKDLARLCECGHTEGLHHVITPYPCCGECDCTAFDAVIEPPSEEKPVSAEDLAHWVLWADGSIRTPAEHAQHHRLLTRKLEARDAAIRADTEQAVREECAKKTARLAGLALEYSGCDMCEHGEELWRGSDEAADVFWHGYGDDVGECDSTLTAVLVAEGFVAVKVLPLCLNGHTWYGEGCPECDEKSEGSAQKERA